MFERWYFGLTISGNQDWEYDTIAKPRFILVSTIVEPIWAMYSDELSRINYMFDVIIVFKCLFNAAMWNVYLYTLAEIRK